MASIYRRYDLRCIPGMRLEIENEPMFKFVSGPPKANLYYKERLVCQDAVEDPRGYANDIDRFFYYVDQKLSVTARMYRIMYNLLQDGKVTQVFKVVYPKRAFYSGYSLYFGSNKAIELFESSIDHSYILWFTKNYSGPKYPEQHFSCSEGIALRYIFHLYFLLRLARWNNRSGVHWAINAVDSRSVGIDMLKQSREYGFLEINSQDGTLASISDII